MPLSSATTGCRRGVRVVLRRLIDTGRSVESAPQQACGIAVLQRRCDAGTMTGFHGYVGVQSRGVIALPTELRRRLHLDEPGAQVEILERDDGVLELRAALPTAADQAWFWKERWQAREREVDELVDHGEVTVHGSAEEFLDHLDHLAEDR